MGTPDGTQRRQAAQPRHVSQRSKESKVGSTDGVGAKLPGPREQTIAPAERIVPEAPIWTQHRIASPNQHPIKHCQHVSLRVQGGVELRNAREMDGPKHGEVCGHHAASVDLRQIGHEQTQRRLGRGHVVQRRRWQGRCGRCQLGWFIGRDRALLHCPLHADCADTGRRRGSGTADVIAGTGALRGWGQGCGEWCGRDGGKCRG